MTIKDKFGIVILILLSIQLNFFPDKRNPSEIENKRYVYLYNVNSPTYPYLRFIIPVITIGFLAYAMRRKKDE